MRVKRFCCNALLLAIGFFAQFLFINSCVGATYGGGSGTAEDPYLISEPNHLHLIHTILGDWDNHFLLVNDIDLSNRPDLVFSPIGGEHTNPFTGVFDGNGHTIINFTCVSNRDKSVGLFGFASNPAVIKNLGLIDPNIQAETSSWVGSLAGEISNCFIQNCWAVGVQVKGSGGVGGLFGFSWFRSENNPITNCHVSGRIEGVSSVGGLIGSDGGYIKNCHSEGQVIATRNYAGGLAGISNGVILNSYSMCDVTGLNYVGGLVGYNYIYDGTYDSDINFTHCYSTGSVSGNKWVGGLIGSIAGSLVYGCYSTGEVSGYSFVGGLIGDMTDGRVLKSFWDIQTSGQVVSAGGQGKNTEQMQSYETFISWSCQPIWTIDDSNDYPHLLWENQPGVLIEKPNYGGGDGTSANPYMIYTTKQLNMIGQFECDWDKNFVLMDDLDLSGYDANNFNLIGDYYHYSENTPFTGVFDGNSHTISNFSYTSFDQDAIGLFRCVGGWFTENAWIKNLTLIDPQINADNGNFVGSLVGSLEYGSVVNCSVIGGNVEGNDNIGGLVGFFRHHDYVGHIISNCNTDINVSGSHRVGGLVGCNETGIITTCSSIGNVYGSGDYIGGLTGMSRGTLSGCYSSGNVEGVNRIGGLVGDSSGTITDSYATGSVGGIGDFIGGLVGFLGGREISNSYASGGVSGGGRRIGGLVGANYGYTNSSIISNCYATGSVVGDERIGGLAGENTYGEVFNSYATGQVTGNIGVGGLIGYDYQGDVVDSFWDINSAGLSLSEGGLGKTTVEMQSLLTYQPWFCTYLWKIDDGNDYPRFLWEDRPGVPMVPPDYAGGSGVLEDPYRVETAEQMKLIGLHPCQWDKHFVLVDDIDLGGYDGQRGRPAFNIIGRNGSFTGVFDGNGHAISNLTYEVTDYSSDIGLFATIRNGGVIQNLTLKNATILGNGSYVGALVGDCIGNIINCASINGNVQGNKVIGGLVGGSIHGKISNSFAQGLVLGNNHDVGGLVGSVGDYTVIIENSYSQGRVSGYNNVGGFWGKGVAQICQCYSSCEVTGSINVGAMIGYKYIDYLPSCNTCFWEKTLNPDLEGIGNNIVDPNLVGLTTVEFMTIQPFESAGWDFVNIWSICEGTNYPHLQWHIPQGDYICPDGVNFYDFAHFSQRWLHDNCDEINNYCDGADLDNLGSVDSRDLAIFCDYWLVGVR